MSRFRSYGPADDPPLDEGDRFFTGVNQFDQPENLQPGEVQAATNIDFTDGTAKTRGGFTCLPALGSNPFGQSWTSRTPATASNWKAVAYGAGKFVAVGVADAIMSSPDGVTWTSRTGVSGADLQAIIYANSLFVAVGDSGGGTNTIETSVDGITWTARTAPSTNSWSGVAYGAGVYTAISNNSGTARAMTSPDGVTWTLRTAVNNGQVGIAYGSGVFCSVGVTSSLGSIQTSPDGVTWTSQTPSDNSSTLRGIAYSGLLFAIVGNGGAIETSPDGITWTSRTAATTNNWAAIAYGLGGFVAVATSGTGDRVMTSMNGVGWFTRPSAANVSWVGVTSGAGIFVAVGNLVVMSSNSASLTVFGSGSYSDPNAVSTPWVVLAGSTAAGFFCFGQTSHSIAYPSGYTITQQSTVVQANNLLFIFPGAGQTPIQWDGNWSGAFVTVPASTLGTGYMDIPQSNQALYYQNRLWVVDGKDIYAASQLLDFQNFNDLTDAFNLNVGSSDYLVAGYPFGDNGIVVFKHKSSFLLQNVDGALTDVTSTEITRELGIVGINACTAVGPDIIYVTDRNITTTRLNLQNKLQVVSEPLSKKIGPIIQRVNWTYASKIAVGYWNNLLFVSLPLDNATVCSTIVVFNFITNQWYGEWNFDATIGMAIQGFVNSNYLGQLKPHVITEDGRIFVFDGGQNDISGSIVAEISTSLTTRAYRMDNDNKYMRRMYANLSTNRPSFSITSYSGGASESSSLVSNQTYARSQSWKFGDTAYDLTNANNDYNRAFRKDYSTGPASVQSGTGFLPEMVQSYRYPLITRRNGRLFWIKLTNTTGFLRANGIEIEARAGDRGSIVQLA